jgi:hypothetical protein
MRGGEPRWRPLTAGIDFASADVEDSVRSAILQTEGIPRRGGKGRRPLTTRGGLP